MAFDLAIFAYSFLCSALCKSISVSVLNVGDVEIGKHIYLFLERRLHDDDERDGSFGSQLEDHRLLERLRLGVLYEPTAMSCLRVGGQSASFSLER